MRTDGNRPATKSDEEKWPIGFMVVLLLAALYLGWRLVQGIAWAIDKI